MSVAWEPSEAPVRWKISFIVEATRSEAAELLAHPERLLTSQAMRNREVRIEDLDQKDLLFRAALLAAVISAPALVLISAAVRQGWGRF